MRNFTDFESLAFHDQKPIPVLEAFSGQSIVIWYGNIERQLVGLVDDYERQRNFPYADKVREFLRIWRQHQITGSINRETLDALETPSSQLSVDPWKLSNYFSNLRDQLRRLIASEEELPRLPQEQEAPTGGGMSGGLKNKPNPEEAPPTEFGPEKKQGEKNPLEKAVKAAEEEGAGGAAPAGAPTV